MVFDTLVGVLVFSVMWSKVLMTFAVSCPVMSLMSVMCPPPALCNLSARTVVKLYTLGIFVLGVL